MALNFKILVFIYYCKNISKIMQRNKHENITIENTIEDLHKRGRTLKTDNCKRKKYELRLSNYL